MSKKKAVTVNKFSGKFSYLSNYYICPIIYKGEEYTSVEAAFQAQKVPPSDRKSFTKMPPNTAKSLGRRVRLPFNWEVIKDEIMTEIVECKFNQNEDLRVKLLGDTTVDCIFTEGNTWHDNYWGHCTCAECEKKMHNNKLGKIISQYRKKIGGNNYDQNSN